MIIPTIIEKGHPVDHVFDIYSCLLKERIIFCHRTIDDDLASVITAQLLYLDSINHEPIQLYINSPGGSVSAGFAIVDTMKLIHSDVKTICMGMCASMAAVILMCGTATKRYALEHSCIMIHQPLGQMNGKVSDIKNTAEHFITIKNQVISLFHQHTRQSIEQITKDIENDTYLTPEMAKKYGIIDNILT